MPDAKSIAPPVLLAKIQVTVSFAVTWALRTKSVTSKENDAIAKSPNTAPVTVTSFASSSPSGIEPGSQVSQPFKSAL